MSEMVNLAHLISKVKILVPKNLLIRNQHGHTDHNNM